MRTYIDPKYYNRSAGWAVIRCHDGKWRFFSKPRKPGAQSVFSFPFENRTDCLKALRRLFQEMSPIRG